MASFPAVKRPHLRLQTSKLKTVKIFEKNGKNFLDKELFSSFGAFYGTKLKVYFFSAQIPKEVRKDLMLWKVGPKELCIL